MSNLVDHARRELELAGLFDEDADYDGDLGPAVLGVVEKFSEYGHSGMSAAISVSILEKLLRFETLTPLTDDPSEWMDVSTNTWQSRRRSEAFSHDGGKTYYLLSDGSHANHQEKLYTSEPHV